MRRTFGILGVMVGLLALSVSTAFADSPSFHFANASVDTTNGNLAVSFKETGLGTTLSTATIDVAAQARATYQCFNNGGNHPKAGNKETVEGPTSASGQFAVRNGQVTGTIEAPPPGPGSFSCPPGQDLFLVAVSYSSITIADVTENDGPVPTTPTSVSNTNLMIPVV